MRQRSPLPGRDRHPPLTARRLHAGNDQWLAHPCADRAPRGGPPACRSARSILLVAVPATRRAFSLFTLIVAFIACVAIPFSFLSGSKLEARLPSSSLIHKHVQLAHQLLPLAALFGVALAVFVVSDLFLRSRSGRLNEVERRLVASRLSASPRRAAVD